MDIQITISDDTHTVVTQDTDLDGHVSEILLAFLSAIQGAGFSYVKDIHAVKESGEIVSTDDI